jgi:uncharacterized protein YndB with AHSA1/START domain
MISVQTIINAPIDEVWELWTSPEHIVKWNTPDGNWQTSHVENDLKVDGKFKFTMISKEQNSGFDFEGIYTKVQKNKVIEYKLEDNRTASVYFEAYDNTVEITEMFEPQKQDSESMQKAWCQAVIDNFKHYVEHF